MRDPIPVIQLLALLYRRNAKRKNRRLAQSRTTVAAAVKAISHGSKTFTIADEGTLTTTIAGMMKVKKKPSGYAHGPFQISRG